MLALWLIPAPAALVQPHNPAVVQIERQGERALISMDVPVAPEQAWAVLTDYANTFAAMPDVQAVEVLSRQGNNVRLRQRLQAPYTFGLAIETVLEGQEDPSRFKLSYALVRGTHIRNLSGHWMLAAIAGGTRIEHTLKLSPDVPSLLLGTFQNLHDTSLREGFRAVRQLMLTQ